MSCMPAPGTPNCSEESLPSPAAIEDWYEKRVAQFVRSLGKAQAWATYAQLLAQEGVDGLTLLDLTLEVMVELGIKKLHARSLCRKVNEAKARSSQVSEERQQKDSALVEVEDPEVETAEVGDEVAIGAGGGGGKHFEESKLLTKEEKKQLHVWTGREGKSGETLLYRGTEHGFGASDFHNHCNNKGATLTVVHVASGGGGHLFGGCASQSWTSRGGHVEDARAWLFSLRNKDSAPQKLAIKSGKSRTAIYDCNCWASYGPTFGGGHDFTIYSGCNGNTASCSNLGHTYEAPPGYEYEQENTKAFLAGSYKFTVAEIEVWQLA